MTAMRALGIAALFSVAACASPAMDPDLSLHDRFVLTALTFDDGSPRDRLRRWDYPVLVQYDGPPRYHPVISDHLSKIAEITGLGVRMDAADANVAVEISERRTGWTCHYRVQGYRAEVHIRSDQVDRAICQCISQELTQILGPGGDLDGTFGSRQDSVFASYGGAIELTPADRQVLRILFDPRLYDGMHRADVLAILPEIVADVEAQQEAGSQ